MFPLSGNTPFFRCKDHTVSGKTFALLHNTDLDMLVTSPIPPPDKLSFYYNSDKYISHTDGRRNGFEKIYQAVKQYMLGQKIAYITKEHPEKGTLLDIGAGTGDFLIAARQKGWEVHGSEPLEQARDRAAKKGLSLKPNTLDYAPHTFNVITLWHTLEHIPNLESQIKELKRLLMPKGKLFIAVPNFKSYDAYYYKEYWAGYDVPRHLWHFSQHAIKCLFRNANFAVVRTIPLVFDAYYVSLLSEQYKSGKMNVLKAFLTGLKSNYKARKTGEYSSLIYLIQNNIL